jgi:ubiquitin-conjugating enzyme E2 variant
MNNELLEDTKEGFDWHYLMEGSAILSLWGLMGWGIYRMAQGFTLTHIPILLAAIFLGYLAADFVSGMIHWLADRYFSPDTPVIGSTFIIPFREHHADPKDITRVDFIQTNGHNSLVTIPVIGVFHFLPIEGGSWWAIGIFSAVLSLSTWIFLTNQFHKWAHVDEAPNWVKPFQKIRICLNVDVHNLHHTYPNDTNYCITSGVLNPFLEWTNFWRRMEWILLKVFNMKPFHDDQLEEHVPLPSK